MNSFRLLLVLLMTLVVSSCAAVAISGGDFSGVSHGRLLAMASIASIAGQPVFRASRASNADQVSTAARTRISSKVNAAVVLNFDDDGAVSASRFSRFARHA
jgi:hypothetical protein